MFINFKLVRAPTLNEKSYSRKKKLQALVKIKKTDIY